MFPAPPTMSMAAGWRSDAPRSLYPLRPRAGGEEAQREGEVGVGNRRGNPPPHPDPLPPEGGEGEAGGVAQRVRWLRKKIVGPRTAAPSRRSFDRLSTSVGGCSACVRVRRDRQQGVTFAPARGGLKPRQASINNAIGAARPISKRQRLPLQVRCGGEPTRAAAYRMTP
jgi:hypothetical protein